MTLFGFNWHIQQKNRSMKGLLIATLTLLCFSGSYAQTTPAEWEAIYAQANNTAIFSNGKIVSLEQTIPNIGTKVFSFSHNIDGSFVLADGTGMELVVSLGQGGIKSIIMPNDENYVFNWELDSTNKWIATNLSCNGSLIEAPDGNPCRDALFAAGLALAVCGAAPEPLHVGPLRQMLLIIRTDVGKHRS